MAYAFSRINGAMGGDEEAQNQDIFGGQSQQQGQVQSQDQQTGTTQNLNTSGADEIGSGSASPNKEIQAPQEASGSGEAGASKILAKNQSTTPDSVSQLGGKLTSAQTGLQNEANAYLNNAKATDYSVSDADTNDLIAGTNDAGATKAAGLLSGTLAPKADAFNPTTNTNFQEYGELKNDAGIQDMFRRQAGPEATQGELGVETALLRRDPKFQSIRSNLISQGQALQDQKNLLTGESDQGAQSQANAAMATNYGNAQTALRGNLSAQQAAIQQSATDKATAENNARHALTGSGQEARDVSSAALLELQKEHPELSGQIAANGLDPNSYFHAGADVTPDQEYDDASAAKYNRINSLLGNGGTIKTSAITPQYTFDTGKYQNDILSNAAAAQKAALPPTPYTGAPIPTSPIFPGLGNGLPPQAAPIPNDDQGSNFQRIQNEVHTLNNGAKDISLMPLGGESTVRKALKIPTALRR